MQSLSLSVYSVWSPIRVCVVVDFCSCNNFVCKNLTDDKKLKRHTYTVNALLNKRGYMLRMNEKVHKAGHLSTPLILNYTALFFSKQV